MPDHVCTQQPCAVCLVTEHQPIPSYMLAEHRRRLARLTAPQLALVERVIAAMLDLEPLPAADQPEPITSATQQWTIIDRVSLPTGGAILFVQHPSTTTHRTQSDTTSDRRTRHA